MEGKSVPDFPGPPCCACSLLHGSIERRRGLGFCRNSIAAPKNTADLNADPSLHPSFFKMFWIERAIFHRNRGTGEGSCRFDNPPKPVLRFLPQIGEWMFMALVAVKLEKAEIWHG